MNRYPWLRNGLATGTMVASLMLVGPSRAPAETGISCGASNSSAVRAETADFTSKSASFVDIPGAAASLTVPAAATRCIKLRFFASARCKTTNANDVCLLRVTVNNSTGMVHPQANIPFAGEDNKFVAHAFQWTTRLGAGEHTVRVQAALQNTATSFVLTAWTMDVEAAQ